MERVELLKNLHHAPHVFKDEDGDTFTRSKLRAFIKQYGQFQVLVTAAVNGTLYVVDGTVILEILKDLGYESAKCFYLGELTKKEYTIRRLLLSARSCRPNYIAMAEAISEIAIDEATCRQLANETHIPYDEIKRYKDLLTFDWEAFEKAPINPNQISLFSNL